MSLQIDFMRKAIDSKIINKWHIWNFARNSNDQQWLLDQFKENIALFTNASSLKYSFLFSPKNAASDLWIEAKNDAHILLKMKSGEVYELVFGAFSNTKHLIRWFKSIHAYKAHSSPILMVAGNLTWGKANHINILQDDKLYFYLNNTLIFNLKKNNEDKIDSIFVHTGYGSDGFWDTNIYSSIKLINVSSSGYDGFKEVYSHYSNSSYADNIFLKMDDDIIYCDLNYLSEFIQITRQSQLPNIFSANVINNGVCAFIQRSKNYYTSSELDFDYPADGLHGNLWESSDLCFKLHSYFLTNFKSIHEKAKNDIALSHLPEFDRFSINFIAFKHVIFAYMVAGYSICKNKKDDEEIMTQILPTIFGVQKYVFNKLLVSHLSFYKQEDSLDTKPIIKAYKNITK